MALRGITPSLSVRRDGLFFKHAGRVELGMGRNKEINKSMHNRHKRQQNLTKNEVKVERGFLNVKITRRETTNSPS